MNSNFFEFLRTELPYAIHGYYPLFEKKLEVTPVEKRKLEKIIEPYILAGYFDSSLDIQKCFFYLYRGLKKKKSILPLDFKIYSTRTKNDLNPLDFKKILEKCTDRPFLDGIYLERVEFHFKDKSKNVIKGNFVDFFFMTIFNHFINLDRKEYAEKINLSTAALFYIKEVYQNTLDKKTKTKSRDYNKKSTYDEFHEMEIKQLCKQLHAFLKKHSTITPTSTKISNQELRLIMEFIEFTELHTFENMQDVRNWILR